MRVFNFYVNYVIADEFSDKPEFGNLPFSAEGNSYEEARSKALEYAQSIARSHNDGDAESFYFYISHD